MIDNQKSTRLFVVKERYSFHSAAAVLIFFRLRLPPSALSSDSTRSAMNLSPVISSFELFPCIYSPECPSFPLASFPYPKSSIARVRSKPYLLSVVNYRIFVSWPNLNHPPYCLSSFSSSATFSQTAVWLHCLILSPLLLISFCVVDSLPTLAHRRFFLHAEISSPSQHRV